MNYNPKVGVMEFSLHQLIQWTRDRVETTTRASLNSLAIIANPVEELGLKSLVITRYLVHTREIYGTY